MVEKETEDNSYGNGFAFPLEPNTPLGIAMLIVEDEEGNYEPIRTVATINEAKELAGIDFRERLQRVDDG